ncbi:MAG: zinc ribbon domain-containing protein [Candidatus Lokiarchaeota archaeon]|nr:zinc ribbon domain-containing protein [Candidatus Lokiarchaeota archaeon]
MALQPGQEMCTFCGESNPLPESSEEGREEAPPVDQKPTEAGPALEKPLHDIPARGSPAPTAQQRDPVCPRCGKDNSKIPAALFCFVCGTALQVRQTAASPALAPGGAERSTSATGTHLDQVCPRCGKDNSQIPNARFCYTCGGTLPAAGSPRPVPRPCPHCGKDLAKQPTTARFCIYCGKTLESKMPSGAPLPAPGGVDRAIAPPQQPSPQAVQEPAQQPAPLHAVQATGPSPVRPTAEPQGPGVPRGPAHLGPARTATAPAAPAKPPVEPVDMLNITCRYEACVLSAYFSKDGTEFLVGTAANECIARQVTSARVRRTIPGERTGKAITVLAERGGTGFVTCMRGTVMRFTRVAVLDLRSGGIAAQVKTSQAAILSVAVNAAGTQLILGGYDKDAEIHDLTSGKLVCTLAGHAGAIDAVAFDPAGKLAATGGRDGDVKVWKAETGEMLRNFSGHEKPVLSLAFSRDCSRLASGSEDGTIKIWDPEKDSPVNTLKGHRGGVLAIAFNDDGKHLVTGGEDTVARVWDVEAAKLLRTVDLHLGAITAVAISPDGKRVVTAGADKRSYHWLLEPGKKSS